MTLILGDISELDVLQLTLKDAYSLFKIAQLQDENTITKEDMEKIKHGIKIKFKIHNYLSNNYSQKAKQEITIIEHKAIPTELFQDELDEREALIKNIIIREMQEPDIIKGRIKKNEQ